MPPSDEVIKPNPGSDAAIDRGCTCPVMDNAHGRGAHGEAGVFWWDMACPLHYPRPEKGGDDDDSEKTND